MREPRRVVVFVFLAVGLGACGTRSVNGEGDQVDPELSMSFMEDVATGSETTAYLRYDCPSGTTSRNCNQPANARATIEGVTVDDPTILELVKNASNPEILTIKALRDCTTNIRVGGVSPNGDKKDFTATIRAATPDRVTIEPDDNCQKPIRVGTSAKFKIKTELFKGPTRLQGMPYPLPIKSDVAKIPPGDARFGIELEAQEKRGTGTIDSTVSTEDSVGVEIYDEEQLANVELTPSSKDQLGGHPLVKKGDSLVLNGTITVNTTDGKKVPLCKENLQRTITSDRPDVCTGSRLHDGPSVIVYTKGAGTCTVTLKIGAFTSSQTIEVRENARGF